MDRKQHWEKIHATKPGETDSTRMLWLSFNAAASWANDRDKAIKPAFVAA